MHAIFIKIIYSQNSMGTLACNGKTISEQSLEHQDQYFFCERSYKPFYLTEHGDESDNDSLLILVTIIQCMVEMKKAVIYPGNME